MNLNRLHDEINTMKFKIPVDREMSNRHTSGPKGKHATFITERKGRAFAVMKEAVVKELRELSYDRNGPRDATWEVAHRLVIYVRKVEEAKRQQRIDGPKGWIPIDSLPSLFPERLT